MIVTWRRLLFSLALVCSVIVCFFYSELRDNKLRYDVISTENEPQKRIPVRHRRYQIIPARGRSQIKNEPPVKEYWRKYKKETLSLYEEAKDIAAHPSINGSVPSLVMENIKQSPPKPVPTDLSRLLEKYEKLNSTSNESDQEETNILDDQTPLNNTVIIYAKCRTGSSFAGEFFNKNDQFFYTFEPVQMLNKDIRSDPHEWLGRALSCQFEELWRMGVQNPIHTVKSLPGWKRKIFCYKLGMSHRCGNMTMSEIEKRCRSYAYSASKVILVPTLTKLVPLMERGAKIVQLVRDPRGIMASRLKIYSGTNKTSSSIFLDDHWSIFHNYVTDYCAQTRADLNTIRGLVLDYSGRGALEEIPYVLVRYEDLAMRPFVEVKRMYKPLDIEPDISVLSWIRSFTLRQQGRTSDVPEQKEMSFGTFRVNSAETAFSWRSYIPWKFVLLIQKECADVMSVLGYPMFESEEQVADPDFSVIKQFSASRRT